MSLQPSRPLSDALRQTLRKLDEEPGPETPNMSDLKRILRERIAKLDANQRLTSPAPSQDTPRDKRR